MGAPDIAKLTESRFRFIRTRFVHRWHAAQTIGEWFGNDAIGHRFEHINHVRSLTEYIWRYGAFAESPDGTGRVPVRRSDSLRSILKPVVRKGRAHLERAVRYAATFGSRRPANSTRHLSLAQRHLLGYGAEHPDVVEFANKLVALHRAMIPYYVEMRYITLQEAAEYRIGWVPVLEPMGYADGSQPPRSDDFEPEPLVEGDLVVALRSVFARNIHNALASRARAEVFETITRHPDGARIASETFRVGHTGRATLAEAVVGRKRRRFVVHDRALASMLASISEEPMPALIRFLAAFRIAVSTMITTMPVFIVKNFFRDTLAGFVAGRYWQFPFLGTLVGSFRALVDLAKPGGSVQMREYLLQGGFYSGLIESEVHLGDITGDDRDGRRWCGVFTRGWSRVIYVLTRPAWLAEAGTRVNQFSRARKAGSTNYMAARAARMVSADFANIGSSRGWRMYVHTVPFLNAAIQGIDQMYQIVRFRWRGSVGAPRWGHDQRRHMAKMLTSGLCLSVLASAGWWHNDLWRTRRAEYQNQTDYEKASWVTLYDAWGDTDIRIPVPFQIGAVFMKLPEVALDLVSGSNTQAGPKFVWSLIHGNLAVGWIPAIAQPIVEVRTNRNFFGEEIIPPYMRYLTPEERHFHRTTPLPYRTVGSWLGVSPLHVQTFVRAWTGHLGNAVVVVLDEKVMWDTRRNGSKPFPKTAPLLTGVYSLQPTRPRTFTRVSNEFYELADWLDRQIAWASRNRARIPVTIRRADNRSERAQRQASRLRREGDEVRMNRGFTARHKEQRIEAIYAQIDGVLAEQLPLMRQARASGR
ncbi:MAG: hypothetical protein OXH51_03925 [Gemmatimonadetes bacterium]|nr:hypothetical protein [Gemmatimonadota bacterium]